jgi:hypothetical protein
MANYNPPAPEYGAKYVVQQYNSFQNKWHTVVEPTNFFDADACRKALDSYTNIAIHATVKWEAK